MNCITKIKDEKCNSERNCISTVQEDINNKDYNEDEKFKSSIKEISVEEFDELLLHRFQQKVIPDKRHSNEKCEEERQCRGDESNRQNKIESN